MTWNWFKLSSWCSVKIAKKPHRIKFITWHCIKMPLNIFNIKFGSSEIMDTNKHWLTCFYENQNNKIEDNKITVIKLYNCYHLTLWFYAIISSNIYSDFCIISHQTLTKMTDMLRKKISMLFSPALTINLKIKKSILFGKWTQAYFHELRKVPPINIKREWAIVV